MSLPLPVSLTIPNDLAYLSLLNAFIDDLATRSGFSAQETLKIQLSTEETFANIVQHDFPDGTVAPVEIIWEAQTLGMTLRFRHKGQPSDPDLFPQLDKAEIERELAARGLGTFLMKQLMNEVQYNNLGYEGQETVLIKYLDKPRPEDSEPVPVPPMPADQPVPVTPVPYQVRPLHPDESVEVARLAYHAYSYSYPYEHIYFPDRVKKLNADGTLASFIAVTDSGEIIAHSATVYDPDWPGVAELGVAFTKTSHRGLGCMNAIWDAMVVACQARGDMGLFVTGVTTHPYSQKTARRYGMTECALALSKVTSIAFQNINDGATQREHLMLFFRFLDDRGPFTVYAPPHHRAMLERIYHEMGCQPQFEEATSSPSLETPPKIEVTTNPSSLAAIIAVRQAGQNVTQEVHLSLRRLCVNRFETVFLELDLSEPATASLCETYEAMGFFFAGILPQQDGRDRLLLQYLNNQRPDYDAITVASDFGRDLLAYVKQQDKIHALL